MIWTNEKPTKAGWYWYNPRLTFIEVYELFDSEQGLCWYVDKDGGGLIKDMRGRWAGPLDPPGEPS
jgi:hypothetical protein